VVTGGGAVVPGVKRGVAGAAPPGAFDVVGLSAIAPGAVVPVYVPGSMV
jgi:hypothetical protein